MSIKWKKITAFEKSDQPVSFIKPNELSEGQILEGVYLGSYTDSLGKTCYRLSSSDGSVKILNGTSRLDRLMSKVAPETQVRITYNGREDVDIKLKNGKSMAAQAHNFTVEVAASE